MKYAFGLPQIQLVVFLHMICAYIHAYTLKIGKFTFVNLMTGNKALTKTHFGASSKKLEAGGNISIVTVFATYDTAVDQQTNGKLLDSVTVGNISYNKVERSIAILNVFINFIQVNPCSSHYRSILYTC